METAISAGADALGFNLVPSSPRCIRVDLAEELARLASGRVERVAVVANATTQLLRRLVASSDFERIQLHGGEGEDVLGRTGEKGFFAVRVAGDADVLRALSLGGDRVLVDAFEAGRLGGTGHLLDADVAKRVTSARRTILAGGLTPFNVAARVQEVQPWGVDVASGVESAPGIKDHQLVVEFVRAAKLAL